MKFGLTLLCFLALPAASLAQCRDTGSSFSRNSNCQREVIVQQNNTYIYGGYERPYYYHYPRYPEYYPPYRDPYWEDRRRARGYGGSWQEYAPKKPENARSRAMERGYAPGFGTSHPLGTDR